MTIAVALLSMATLPKGISACYFWSEEDQSLARRRILRDSSHAVEEEYSHSTFFKPLKDPTLYAFLLIGLCYGTTGAVAGTFLPLLVGRMGLNPVQTNLYTVGPNVVALFCVISTSRSSDFLRERSLHLLSAMGLTLFGLLMLLAAAPANMTANYVACFLVAAGAFTPSVIFHTWHNCQETSMDGRAFRTGLLTFATNSGGIIAGNIFLSWEAPNYHTAILASAIFELVGMVLVILLRIWMMWDNRQRDKLEGIRRTSKDIPSASLKNGPRDPSFRYFL